MHHVVPSTMSNLTATGTTINMQKRVGSIPNGSIVKQGHRSLNFSIAFLVTVVHVRSHLGIEKPLLI